MLPKRGWRANNPGNVAVWMASKFACLAKFAKLNIVRKSMSVAKYLWAMAAN
jgi:hypothetical protein